MDIDLLTTETAQRMQHLQQEKEKEWQGTGFLPSVEDIGALMQVLRRLFFPTIYAPRQQTTADATAQQLQAVASLARPLIEAGLRATQNGGEGETATRAEAMTQQFISELPSIQSLLSTDVEAVGHNDPAATSPVEIVSCYPAITVMLHYRVAHALYEAGVPLVPRMMTERAHSITGVDIHPAAHIGASFGIDHGTGIVIGETAVIGNEVMIYQGVTLGAKNFHRSEEGTLLNEPRHPIIEDRVTIYSNSTLLGRIRIGHDSIIGGNLWITKDVAPHSQVRQPKPVKFHGFIDGAGI